METIAPRWDRNRIVFEIDYDGQWVECAVSREALQDISGRRYAKPAELMDCFARMQPMIDRIARDKLRRRSDAIDGLVTIWSSDLDELEPEDGAEAEPDGPAPLVHGGN